eukprot:4394114-Amphidinium_carterae.1
MLGETVWLQWYFGRLKALGRVEENIKTQVGTVRIEIINNLEHTAIDLENTSFSATGRLSNR